MFGLFRHKEDPWIVWHRAVGEEVVCRLGMKWTINEKEFFDVYKMLKNAFIRGASIERGADIVCAVLKSRDVWKED